MPTSYASGDDALADVDDDSPERVQLIGIGLSGIDGIEEAELGGEGDAVGELGEALEVLLILEPLEVEGEDAGELLETHALLGLLQPATGIAGELVLLSCAGVNENETWLL
jgi:hypothetical protein